MAQRVGLRLNPVSGTSLIGLPLDGAGFGFSLIGSTSHEYIAPEVTDGGGGSSVFFGPFGLRSGLQKSVSLGSPWTIWFEPIAGTYTGFSVAELDTGSSSQDIRFRLILEDDGIETVIDDATETTAEGMGSTIFATTTQTVAFVIGAVSPSAFWTDFEKTRENSP